jgi:hypothetical protein
MKTLTIHIFILLILSQLANAQINFNPLRLGFSSFSAGYTTMTPSFKPEVSTERWHGVHFRGRILEFMFTQGGMTYQDDSHPDYHTGKGSMMNLGINIPFHRLSIVRRKDYFKGIHITPILGVHYATATAMHTRKTQGGLNVAPGLNIQLPFVVADLRLNTSMYFGEKEHFSTYRGNLVFTPSLSLQFDGLFEVLGGRSAQSGTFDYTYRVLEDIETSYNEDRTIKTEKQTYGNYASHSKTFMTIQRAFWYVKPAFGVGLKTMPNDISETYQPGNAKSLSVGGRWMYFMGDVGIEQTNGYFASRDPKFIEELADYADTYPKDLTGSFNGLELRGKVGLDLVSLVQGVIMPKSMRGAKSFGYKWAKFVRIQGGVSGGILIPGKMNFADPEAPQKLDAYFAANPDLPRNKQTDLGQIGTGTTIGLFTNIEFGAASFEFDWHGNHDLGWHTSFRVGYLIPIQEIGRYVRR